MSNLAVPESKLPRVLPSTVARVTANGLPTKHLIDWEQLTRYWYEANTVALDTKLTEVSATADNAAAAVVQEAEARASADGALASQITTVDAKANNATASGAIYFAAKAAPSGATAAYGLYLTAGGTFTGFEAVATTGGGYIAMRAGEVEIEASKFKLTDAGTSQNVFNYSSGVFTFNVPVRVRNGDINDGAVTRAWQSEGNTTASVNINFRGTGFLEIYAQFDGDATIYNSVDQFVLRVLEDGAIIKQIPLNHAWDGTGTSTLSRYGATSVVVTRTPSAGNHTYAVQLVRVVSATGLELSGVLIVVKEFSK